MKFKKDAIKPNMVIHCPKEEDARALLEHLDGLGYGWANGQSLDADMYYFGSDARYFIEPNKQITPDCIYGSKHLDENEIITEFSDLIKPDSPVNSPTDSPMSAVEVLEWIEKNCDDESLLQSIFGDGCENCDDIFGMYPPKEILKRITAYEATKKAPKPVEVEFGWHCEVFELCADGYSPKIHDSYDLWEGDENNAMDDAVDRAAKHTEKTGKQTYAQVFATCRIKED